MHLGEMNVCTLPLLSRTEKFGCHFAAHRGTLPRRRHSEQLKLKILEFTFHTTAQEFTSSPFHLSFHVSSCLFIQ